MGLMRAVFIGAALAVTMLAAGSCVSSSGQATGQTTDTPPESASPASTPTIYTLDQVRAALPPEAALKEKYDNVSRTDPTTVALFCGDDGATASDDSSGATISAQSPRKAGGWNVFSSVVMTGLVFPSHQAAQRFMSRSRTTAERCEGKIDHKPVKVDDAYRPGERGRGTLSDLDTDGWQGYRLVTVTRWWSPKDPTGPSIAHGNAIVVRGNTVFAVSAVRPDDKSKVVTRTLDRWASRVTREME